MALDKPRSLNVDDEIRFNTIISKFGLGVEARALLFAKFVENKSLDEIAREQGYVNKNAAAYYYRQLLRQLQERGFKLTKDNT